MFDLGFATREVIRTFAGAQTSSTRQILREVECILNSFAAQMRDPDWMTLGVTIQPAVNEIMIVVVAMYPHVLEF